MDPRSMLSFVFGLIARLREPDTLCEGANALQNLIQEEFRSVFLGVVENLIRGA